MTDLGEKSNVKRTTVMLIALAVAIAYSLALTLCVLLVRNTDNTSTANTSSTSSQPIDSIGTDGASSNIDSSGQFNSPLDWSSVNSMESSGGSSSESTESQNSSDENTSSEAETPYTKPFTAAIWYSFEDLNFVGYSTVEFKQAIDKMFDDAVTLGCDAVIVQVRPFADALYYSNYFPHSSILSGTQGVDPGYDALDYMVKAAHNRDLQIHAWLNPYRVTLWTDDYNSLSNDHIVRKWMTDDNSANDRNVLKWESRLYFNPAILEVHDLILNGVREIVKNYDVDGIHIDDYFYPSTTPVGDDFDKPEYNTYVKNGGKLSLGDWRRNNVSTLVSGIYRVIKDIDSSVVFGVSPAYNISKDGIDDNYQKKYADLKKWMSTAGYIDYIVPQLYFGYNYSKFEITYDYLLNLWMSMPRHKNMKIYIGLAAYKIGDAQADLASGEWIADDDILARQTIDAMQIGCDGVMIFNYSTIMSADELTTAQRENLKEVLNNDPR